MLVSPDTTKVQFTLKKVHLSIDHLVSKTVVCGYAQLHIQQKLQSSTNLTSNDIAALKYQLQRCDWFKDV